ncbi:phosphatase PAP2 family protein [Streptomyces sp. PA03-6a]|nr:phosphatase PAP2 family protein [Streptomyces sp. PA03-6a]
MANTARFIRQLLPRTSRPPNSRAPRWWAELLLVGVLYAVYETTRGLQRGWDASADGNGRSIQRWENAVHMAPEQPLNQVLHQLPVLAVAAAYFYATLHYVVTPAVLIWLYRRHPTHYRGARTWLATVTLAALVAYWRFPTTPPRLLSDGGIHDIVADVEHWGWWSGETSAPQGLGSLVNEYAAMPSLHVGWAVWSGWLLFRHSRRKTLRGCGLAYPVLTTLVVVATGNHYLADAVAGALLIVLFGSLTALVSAERSARSGARRVRPDHPDPHSQLPPRQSDMPHSPLPSLPGDGDRPSVSRTTPDSGHGTGKAGGWLRSRRPGQTASHLTLHLGDVFLVGDDAEGPTGGLVRFRIPDAVEDGRPRRSWWPRTDVGRHLAGSTGELRLVRNHRHDGTTAPQALIAVLTLNGITDVVPLVRFDIADTLPHVADADSGRAAAVDVHFFAGLWDLPIPARTKCRVHLEGPARLLPDWPGR